MRHDRLLRVSRGLAPYTALLWALVLVLSLVAIARAQAPTVTPAESIGFDYLDANLTQYAVTSFSVQWDNGAWVSIGMPAGTVLPDTILGGKTYKVVPPFTSGMHTMNVRAVNAAGPGAAMSSPFAFASVGSSPAGVPANVRVVPR